MDALFPYRKDFPDGRLAYVAPLTFGRGRICTTTLADWSAVLDGW
jgi:hypothetical protein